jgi:adenosylcobinamide kinase/adenosylcobinamide-phosphate guanylyltransferase
VFGGIRSGKSGFAKMLASREENVTFIATCQATDSEMKQRIEEHKRTRPSNWKTIEEGEKVGEILKTLKEKRGAIIIDCLGMLITNLLEKKKKKEILESVNELILEAKKLNSQVIVVSNEVGMTIVSSNKVARLFSDILGEANQLMAKEADEVYILMAGIPTKLKG